MFADTFNYHDGQVQLRFLGLAALLLTLVCLGLLELRKNRSRRTTLTLTLLSALGTAVIALTAFLTSGHTS
jgi:hypothetical protein